MTNKVYRAKNLVAKNTSRMNDMYKNTLSCFCLDEVTTFCSAICTFPLINKCSLKWRGKNNQEYQVYTVCLVQKHCHGPLSLLRHSSNMRPAAADPQGEAVWFPPESTTLIQRFFYLFQLRRAQQVRVFIHSPRPVAAFCASAWVSGSLARSCVSFLSAAWIAATSRGLIDTQASEPRLAPAVGSLLDRGLDFWVASLERMG